MIFVRDKGRNTDSRPNSIKLGVHVRRGDYTTWHGGNYYY